jgi:protein MpaA
MQARQLAALIALVGVAGGLVGLADGDGTPRRARQVSRLHKRPRPPAPSTPRVMTIGYSVKHRPLRTVLLGDPRARRSVLVVGCIHGNEPAGIAIAKRLAAGASPPGTALWIAPVLNPDGVAIGTRQNADGVDLNRNFPYRWRPLGTRGYLQYSGPRALSEPEARAARRLILKVKPRISIWFHQPQGLVDLSGGDPAFERRFAHFTGLPALRLTRYPGSAVGWENWRLPGTTAFVVELPPGALSRPSAARYAAAVLRLAAAG